MSFRTSSDSVDRGKDNDYVKQYRGVIISYDYASGSGKIEFLTVAGSGIIKRRVGFRREYVLVGSSYALNVGEEVMFNIDRESSSMVGLKNIIPVGLEERVRERFRHKALEVDVLVSARLAKLRTKK